MSVLLKQIKELYEYFRDFRSKLYLEVSNMLDLFYNSSKNWNGKIPTDDQLLKIADYYEDIINIQREYKSLSINDNYITMVANNAIIDNHVFLLEKLLSTRKVNEVFYNMDLMRLICTYIPEKSNLYRVNTRLSQLISFTHIKWTSIDMVKLTHDSQVILSNIFLKYIREDKIDINDWRNMEKCLKKYKGMYSFFITELLMSNMPVRQRHILFRFNFKEAFISLTPVISLMIHQNIIPSDNKVLLRCLYIDKKYFYLFVKYRDSILKFWKDTEILPDDIFIGEELYNKKTGDYIPISDFRASQIIKIAAYNEEIKRIFTQYLKDIPLTHPVYFNYYDLHYILIYKGEARINA